MGEHYARAVSRIFTTSVASVYPHYVTKVEKKGRTTPELHQVIEWLTGFDETALQAHLGQCPRRRSAPMRSYGRRPGSYRS